MEVEKILDAGSGILSDVMAAVETNHYQDLGKRISDRVMDATAAVSNARNGSGAYTSAGGASAGTYRQGSPAGPAQGGQTGGPEVYTGTVEPTNRKDGVFHTNFADGRAFGADRTGAPGGNYQNAQNFSQGAYSSDAYRRYSSQRRNGPTQPNSSSRARAAGGGYAGGQNRAGYSHVYGNNGGYGRYDYNNPARGANLKQDGANAGASSGTYQQAGYQQAQRQNAQRQQARRGSYGQYDSRNPNYQQNMAAANKAKNSENFALTPFNSKVVSKSTGIPGMVLGSMGMAAGGLGTVVSGIATAAAAMAGGLASVLSGGVLIPLIGFAGFTGVSGVLFSNGKHRKDTVSDYYSYGKYVGNAEFFSIPELAAKLGIKEKELKKKLQKMMRQGLLPKARMDDDQEMLLLTDKAYDQYRAAADSYKKRQEEDEKREHYFTQTSGDETVKTLLAEGNEYLKKVRKYNELIPDTEMSDKLYRLENIMYRIFEQVQKKPETALSLRKFMEYYLPTTEKLLSAYTEVDKQPQVGDNITNTKKEIDEAMDVINDAFEKLLDSLFEDLAWDVSSDISVMKHMLQQDGLTGEQISSQQAAAASGASNAAVSDADDAGASPASTAGTAKEDDPFSIDDLAPPSGLVFGDPDED